MPAVSVIVPVYNVESYMARCVRSLFGQTLSDIEYIFVDDCSLDASMEIMWRILTEEFPFRIPYVKVFRMAKNSGQAKVRMQGISMATGDYVIHCDSDDMVDPDAYRSLYEKAIKDNLDIVTCDFMWQRKDTWQVTNGECSGIKSFLLSKACWCLGAKLVKHELVENALLSPHGNFGEDMVLCTQYVVQAQTIGHLKKTCYYYYDRISAITKVPGLEADVERWQSMYENVMVIVNYLCQYGYSGDEPEMINFKYSCRAHLVPYVHRPYYYRLWRSSFPEIDRYFIFTPGVHLETKFWFVLIHLHLYHPWKMVTNALRRRNKGNL